MNALKVSQSRFAVLKIEDDDITAEATSSSSPGKRNSHKTAVSRKVSVHSNNTVASLNSSGSNKAKRPKKRSSSVNAADAGTTSAVNSSAPTDSKCKSKSNEKGHRVTAKQQWEEWKEKDSKFVSDAFEQDLQEALLQSKLEFEEQKKQRATLCGGEHQSTSASADEKKKKPKKKEKPASMSLEEFHNMNGNEESSASSPINQPAKDMLPTDEKDFFCELDRDVERILQREHIKESGRAIDVQGGDKLLCLQHEKEIREKDERIRELTERIDKLAGELKLVKTRNKKLCGILAQAEMREKAEILVHVENLMQVKDELTQQVTVLHGSLEQEKSKVHGLQLELKRYQELKRETRESTK